VRRTLRHPADRTDGVARGRFEHLAEYGAFLASSPFFFGVCLLVIVAWIVGLIVGASNRFEVAVAGLISALTLVLVALLKNAELRSERAIQQKLDAIAGALLQDRVGGKEGESERDLEDAIGLHEDI
jgi:low affinity Fe/Cu permease